MSSRVRISDLPPQNVLLIAISRAADTVVGPDVRRIENAWRAERPEGCFVVRIGAEGDSFDIDLTIVTCRAVVARELEKSLGYVEDELIDDFALELANIWAGRVKYELAQMGIRCNISLPCLARNWPVAPPFHVSFEHEGTTVAVGVEWGGCFPPEETSLGDLEAATMILF
ncbi:MAG: hypothetical protein RID81_31255 [Sandaracinaceae bacterium]